MNVQRTGLSESIAVGLTKRERADLARWGSRRTEGCSGS
ncbi:hypothetical protein SHJG_1482 [Streptomyces hygroscopicus subsp. jinggangensis 5008]|nr:hypothetical protein SHJG_1482 [Streptomyces hygroscopicus subsp. jinggangensis 5008]AGF60979.1 hypothetical protein SHJGH_1313 [Streptomyces hygroscopicus subsp. jinggangensis TL01]